jgi:hypothetical protein
MEVENFYALVVLLLACNDKDSLTKQKARTRWERLRRAALLSLPKGVIGFVVGLLDDDRIRRRMALFIHWNPDRVGVNTLRWFLGEVVAVEDVLREAEQYWPEARKFYEIKCKAEQKKRIKVEAGDGP